MPTHHLDQHDPLMGFGCAVQPVDCLGGDGQRRIESECDIGAIDIVIDGLGHPDHGNVLVGQPAGGGEGAFSADRDQHIDPVVVEGLLDLIQSGTQPVGVGACGTEHRPALGEQPIIAIVVVKVDSAVLQ
ncbi:Uncharacterised protein [Mycobacteroides abscessus subsp. abscessus]|nr:Uncharacterised protein [Mycobacteroides abscessus subsp. abscessus]